MIKRALTLKFTKVRKVAFNTCFFNNSHSTTWSRNIHFSHHKNLIKCILIFIASDVTSLCKTTSNRDDHDLFLSLLNHLQTNGHIFLDILSHGNFLNEFLILI